MRALSLLVLLASPALARDSLGAVEETAPAKRVLVLELRGDGVDEETARTLSGILHAAALERAELDVTTESGLREMVALEARRQEVGCDADRSCLAELAGALGADVVVHGRVGRLGAVWVVSLGAFDALRGEEIARVSLEAERAEALPGVVRTAAERVLDTIAPRARPPVDDGWSPWLLTGATVATVGAGAVLVGGAGALLANARIADTTPPSSAGPTYQDKEAARTVGRVALAVAAVGTSALIAGGAAIAVGAVE